MERVVEGGGGEATNLKRREREKAKDLSFLLYLGGIVCTLVCSFCLSCGFVDALSPLLSISYLSLTQYPPKPPPSSSSLCLSPGL